MYNEYISNFSLDKKDPVDVWFKNNREKLADKGINQVRFVANVWCPDDVVVCWVSPKTLATIEGIESEVKNELS